VAGRQYLIPGDEHEAATAELAGFGKFGSKALGVQDGRVLLDEFASNPVGRDTVSVGDMKEEPHASG
jgi:hypothetical protein